MMSEQIELPNPPRDGITNVSFIDDQFLLVSSWDKVFFEIQFMCLI